MKKNFIYLIFAAISLLSALACTTIINDPDDIDDNGIFGGSGGGMKIDVMVGTQYVSEKFISKIPPDLDNVNILFGGSIQIASGKCLNGRLVIDLPNTLPNHYLRPLNDFVGGYEYYASYMGYEFNGIFSDKNAQMLYGIQILARKKNGGYVYFDYSPLTSFEFGIHTFIYVDRDVTIKGTQKMNSESVVEFDCSFKKGWNSLYLYENTYGTRITYTTQQSSNLNYGWIWMEY